MGSSFSAPSRFNWTVVGVGMSVVGLQILNLLWATSKKGDAKLQLHDFPLEASSSQEESWFDEAKTDLTRAGYTNISGPLDVAGAQGKLYRAIKHGGQPALIKCISNPADQARENRILRALPPHGNVVKLFQTFDRCVAMEAMTPVGYDLFRVAKMYENLKHTKMPFQEMQNYMFHISHGVSHLHEHGIIHCDLKAENIVIGAADEGRNRWHAKIIDFGQACEKGTPVGCLRAEYKAPEYNKDALAASTMDMWGMGGILWQIAIGKNLPDACNEIYRTRWLNGILKCWTRDKFLENQPIDIIHESLKGLLHLTVKYRWTLQKFKKAKVMKPHDLPLNPTKSLMTTELQDCPNLEQSPIRYSRVDVPMVSFALKVTGDLVGKKLGPEPGLNLRKCAGALALYVHKADGKIEDTPGRDTVLQKNDWIFLARDVSRSPEIGELDMTVERVKEMILQDIKAQSDLTYCQIWPEFDEFDFPKACFGAYIFPKVGERFLDLRRNYGINLVAIKRRGRDGEFAVIGPAGLDENTKIVPGDIGVVIRVPSFKTCFSKRVLKTSDLRKLEQFHG